MAIDWTDAFSIIRTMLAQWGLSALEGQVSTMLQDGDPQEIVVAKLRDSKEYKERFAANADRLAKGMAPLSEGEYIATEMSYRAVMRSYGLPEGFYDSQDDFRRFLAADVSPQEMQDRVVLAAERYQNADQDTKRQFTRFGLTPGEAVASILDPDAALPVLRQKLTAASIAAEAATAFRDDQHLSTERALDLAQKGVTEEQARRGFGELGARSERDKGLAALSGYTLDDKELEDEALLGRRSRTRERALAQEGARFKGGYVGQETGLVRGGTNQGL
jgi:hypothetical protein